MSSAPITVAAGAGAPGARAGSPLRVAVATSMAAKALEFVTLVLLAALVPRALGPEAYGRFAVPLAIVTLGSLALTLGGPTLMARYVPAAPAPERMVLAVETGYAALAVGLAVGATYAVLQAFTVSLPYLAEGDDPDAAEAVLRRLAGAAAAGLLSTRMLPAAAGAPLASVSLVSAAAVLLVAPSWWGPPA